METNVYKKLSNMRAALKKELFDSFDQLVNVVSKKAKDYKLLPLFSVIGDTAVLKIVSLDDLDTITFEIPVGLVGLQNAKEQLYKMAFDIGNVGDKLTGEWLVISPEQYMTLMERMKELDVTEKKIQERYHVKDLKTMTVDVYQRCMKVMDQMTK